MVFKKKYYSKNDRLFDSDEYVSFTEESAKKSRFKKLLCLAVILSIVFISARYCAYLFKRVSQDSTVKRLGENHGAVLKPVGENHGAVFENYESLRLSPTCDRISDEFKFDCFPRGQADQTSCEERGCCWSPTAKGSKVPYCYFPKNFHSYKVVNVTKSCCGLTLILNITANSVYPDDVRSLKMNVYFETPTRLRVKVRYLFVSCVNGSWVYFFPFLRVTIFFADH